MIVRQKITDTQKRQNVLSRRRFLQLGITTISLEGIVGCGSGSDSSPISIDNDDSELPDDSAPEEIIPEVPLFGLFELTFEADRISGDAFRDNALQLVFMNPDQQEVLVDGFYNGNNEFKARAYCGQLGIWQWRSLSSIDNLNNLSGSFSVLDSNLPGKLKLHAEDSRQFMTDNGQWFLHIGDTAYRYSLTMNPCGRNI